MFLLKCHSGDPTVKGTNVKVLTRRAWNFFSLIYSNW